MKRAVEWTQSTIPVDYQDAENAMLARAAAIRDFGAAEWVWMLEHPPLYTVGSSITNHASQLDGIPVYASGRGGQITYHGPGQRIVYVMLDLHARKLDVRGLLDCIEQWIQSMLAALGLKTWTAPDRRGVWCRSHIASHTPTSIREAKIAAIGLRIRRGVSLHGFALNINPDLRYFNAIVPCGLEGFDVTSLHALGIADDLSTVYARVDSLIKSLFSNYFE